MLTRGLLGPTAAARAVPLRAHRRHLHLLFGTANIPHPSKRDKGGEDAFFADTVSGAFGVADGVGGSARDGIDPGLFSRTMLSHCQRYLAEHSDGPLSSAHLTRAMAASSAALQRDPVGGSSTLLLGQLGSSVGSSAQLYLANIGDSAALLLRPTPRRFARAGTVLWPRLVARTHEQTHYFNCPFQVAAEDMLAVVEGSTDVIQVDVRAGDIIVAATDGVTDNLFDERVQGLVAAEARRLVGPSAAECSEALQAVADALANEAVAVGSREDDPKLATPFSVHAGMEGYTAPGGKLDDVAVVVGVVREGSADPASGLQVTSNFRE